MADQTSVNAYGERVMGSIRRECLDHVIVLNAIGLHRALADYVAYYRATVGTLLTSSLPSLDGPA
jgi:hypothetical protein